MNTLAQTNIITGEQRFHPDFKKFRPHVQYLVHCHERAHYRLGSTNCREAWKLAIPEYLKQYSKEELQDAINQTTAWHKQNNAMWANFDPITLSIIMGGLSLAGSGVGMWGQNKAQQAQKNLKKVRDSDYISQTQTQTQAAYENAIADAVKQEKTAATLTYVGGAFALVLVFFLIYKKFKKS